MLKQKTTCGIVPKVWITVNRNVKPSPYSTVLFNSNKMELPQDLEDSVLREHTIEYILVQW